MKEGQKLTMIYKLGKIHIDSSPIIMVELFCIMVKFIV